MTFWNSPNNHDYYMAMLMTFWNNPANHDSYMAMLVTFWNSLVNNDSYIAMFMILEQPRLSWLLHGDVDDILEQPR